MIASRMLNMPTTNLPVHHHKMLRAIAIFEAVKGFAAIIASFGLLSFTHQNIRQMAALLVGYFHLDADAHYFKTLFDYTDLLNNEDLRALVLLAYGYAAVRFVESYGLWKKYAWAEWLAAVSGAIYLPIEVSHLIKHVSILNILLLSTNVAVVAFMIYRLRWRRLAALRY